MADQHRPTRRLRRVHDRHPLPAPVHVTFLSGDAYVTAVGATGAMAAGGADDDAVGRALGLWNGRPSADIAAAGGGSTAASFPAVWQPERDVLVVDAVGARAELDPRSRFTITALLTEVLQDELYDTVTVLHDARSAQAREALQMVSVGQASWVGDRYIAELDGVDRDRIERQFSAAGTARAAVDEATPVSRLLTRDLRQHAGEAFIAAVRAEDPGAVARAFTTDRPTAVDQVVLPASKYLRHDRTETAAAPPAPRDATLIRSDIQVGPATWSLLFQEGSADNVALRAADGWGNDAATAYRLGGRVCVDGRIVTDGRAGADRIEAALHAWAGTRPAASDVRVGRHGDELLYSVCDPGVDAHQIVIDDEDRAAILGRTDQLASEISTGRTAQQAECIWVPMFQRYTLDQIDEDDAAVRAYDDAVADCTG